MVDFDTFFKNFCDSVDALPEMGYLIARDNNDEEIKNIVNEWQELSIRQDRYNRKHQKYVKKYHN